MNISTNDFKKAVDTACRVVPGNAALHILETVRIEARVKEQAIVVSGTNLDIATVLYIPANVTADGCSLIRKTRLKKIVNSLPRRTHDRITIGFERADDLKIENDDGTIHFLKRDVFNLVIVTKNNASITIKSEFSPADYPDINLYADERIASWHENDFKLASQRVSKAVANDEDRPTLTCVNISQWRNNCTRFVSADGFRLHIADIENVGDAYMMPAKSQIPYTAFEEISRLCSKKGGNNVSLSVDRSNNRAVFTLKTPFALCKIVSIMIEGNFPDWSQIMPKTWFARVELNTHELLEAAKMFRSVVESDETHLIEFGVWAESPRALFVRETETSRIVINLKSAPDITLISKPLSGEQLECICTTYNDRVTSANFFVGMSSQFLIDALEHVTTETITLSGTNHRTPFLIEQPKYQSLIMPMQKN